MPDDCLGDAQAGLSASLADRGGFSAGGHDPDAPAGPVGGADADGDRIPARACRTPLWEFSP